MKALAALVAASALVYVGLAPDAKPARTVADPPRSLPQLPDTGVDPADLEPVPVQAVPPGGFERGRPVMLRIPPGYGNFRAGDYKLVQAQDGVWGGNGLTVTSYPGWPPQLCVHYDEQGLVYINTRGQPTRAAFCDMHGIAADGTWWPHNRREPPIDDPTRTTFFPDATQPWRVWQP
jgi:hypothetical protein